MGTGIVAQQTSGGALDIGTGAGLTALVLAVIAAAVIAWLHVSTRPTRVRAGEPTMDVGDEPPAVVGLLTSGFRVEDQTMPATVMDLAHRGYFSIDDIGGDRIVLRLRTPPTDDQLTAYETRVLRHVERNQTNGVVPAPVLTLGPQGVSEKWFRSFTREVTKHAQSLGLTRRRWDLKHVGMAWGAVLLAGAPAALLANTAPRTPDPAGWGAPGNLFAGMAFVLTAGLVWVAQRVSRADDQVDLPPGTDAARHWLGVKRYYEDHGRFDEKPAASVAIWDRNLAYATAMGLAPLVQRQIPFETEHDKHAWSRATGHWRRVTVSYRSPVPSWGDRPISVAFRGLVQGVVLGILTYAALYVAGADIELDQLTDDQRRMIGFGALVVAAITATLALVAVVRLVLGVSDLFGKRTVEGELVRRRATQRGDKLPPVIRWLYRNQRDRQYGNVKRGDRLPTTYHLAIDTGDGSRIRAFRVNRRIHDQVRQGAVIRAVVTRRLGYVSSVETITPPPADSPDRDPVEANPLVAETVRRATGALRDRLGAASAAGGVAGMAGRLEEMTDEQGRPVLDQTDDDGVTLRERLAESTSQLDRALADPRIAGSGIAQQILGTLRGDGEPDRPRADHDDRRDDQHDVRSDDHDQR